MKFIYAHPPFCIKHPILFLLFFFIIILVVCLLIPTFDLNVCVCVCESFSYFISAVVSPAAGPSIRSSLVPIRMLIDDGKRAEMLTFFHMCFFPFNPSTRIPISRSLLRFFFISSFYRFTRFLSHSTAEQRTHAPSDKLTRHTNDQYMCVCVCVLYIYHSSTHTKARTSAQDIHQQQHHHQ